jgi:hypothetical protein
MDEEPKGMWNKENATEKKIWGRAKRYVLAVEAPADDDTEEVDEIGALNATVLLSGGINECRARLFTRTGVASATAAAAAIVEVVEPGTTMLSFT